MSTPPLFFPLETKRGVEEQFAKGPWGETQPIISPFPSSTQRWVEENRKGGTGSFLDDGLDPLLHTPHPPQENHAPPIREAALGIPGAGPTADGMKAPHQEGQGQPLLECMLHVRKWNSPTTRKW